MKRKVIILVCLLLTMCLYGCGNGHESDAELVDIEQFKCQDSIESVFDVLGTVKFEKGNYTYENLNLWGYNGTATFAVRTDRDIIKEFYCDLVLNEKEFKELLSYFEEEYGSYVETEYGDSKIVYNWIIGEETYEIGYKEGEVGYDEVKITFEGEENYQVAFRDEWSGSTDEVYSVYADETEIDNYTVLAEARGDVAGDLLELKIINRNGKYELICYGNVDSELNASILLALLVDTCESMKTSFNGYTVGVTREDGGSCIISWDGTDYTTTGINEDGTVSFSLPDWYSDEVLMSDREFPFYVTSYEKVWEVLAEDIQNNLD